ncbi:MAG: membrane protein insertase YidC [Lactobacillus sp.]|nr:membrane protein insertase YidC [Lactobacillus sp.]
MKAMLKNKKIKLALVIMTVLIASVVLTGCASSTTMKPISHSNGSWWDRWIIYYFSEFILFIAKIFGNNYGIAIIAFTILIKAILIPLNAISIKSNTKMQAIQPQIKALQQKYSSRDAETQQILREETSKLYKEAGVNPYAGCLPLLIQMPVLIVLYQAILRTPQLQTGKFLWMNLGKPDPYYVMAILAAVFTFLSSYIAQLSTPKSAQNGMTKSMTYIMAVMVGFWAIYFQSAISLYWVVSNLFQMVQTFVLQNPIKYRQEQARKAELEKEVQRKLRKARKRATKRK